MSKTVIHGEGLGKSYRRGAGDTSPLSFSGRIPELDGIRGVAIGMVLLYHYFGLTVQTHMRSPLAYLLATTRLSWTGVDLFFVLSGFLIGGILLDAKNSTNYFRVFYTRRFFRIVPIYAVLLLTFFVASHAGGGLDRGDFRWLWEGSLPWYSYGTFVQNFWMAHAGNLGPNGLAITWSLAIEEQFYLTLPLLVRLLSGRRLMVSVLGGILFAPLLRTSLHFLWPSDWVAPFVLMPCRADALLLGVLVALVMRDAEWKARIQRSRLLFVIAIPVLFASLLVLTLKAPSPANPFMASVGYTWTALFYASVFLYALNRPDSWTSQALRAKWLGWLGTIAYGTYLLHQEIQGLLYGYLWSGEPRITGAATLLTGIVALLFTLVIARVSWKYFELPLIRIGHRTTYNFGSAGEKQAQRIAGLVT